LTYDWHLIPQGLKVWTEDSIDLRPHSLKSNSFDLLAGLLYKRHFFLFFLANVYVRPES
jgi:hypothetical protein